MNTLDSIRKPIQEPLTVFEARFRTSLLSNVSAVNQVVEHFVSASGKRVRPIVVFLSGGLLGCINEQTQRLALMVELLHSASLLHDDVIDDSDTRRSLRTINAIWGNKYAVILGDYVLSKCIAIATEEDTSLISLFAFVSQALAEGELLQEEAVKGHIHSEERYYAIIRRKTGALFQICCEGAAVAAGLSNEKRNLMKMIGMNLGMMFQIKDDILDYMENTQTGKRHGNDIREGKITLPLIYFMQQYPAEKNKVIHLLDTAAHHPEKIHELIRDVILKGGIEYAQAVISRLHRESVSMLGNFPNSEYKQALTELLDFLEVRNQ